MATEHEDNFDPEFFGVLHLEDHDFSKNGHLVLPDEFKGKYCVVMVFATWCGPCKRYKPEHCKLLKMLGPDVVVACINGSGQTTLKSEQKLMKRIREIIPDFAGFPTIVLFGPDGKILGSHEGKRTAEDVKTTIAKYKK
jgi:thiol-disulfide isomerase/thioredoxin